MKDWIGELSENKIWLSAAIHMSELVIADKSGVRRVNTPKPDPGNVRANATIIIIIINNEGVNILLNLPIPLFISWCEIYHNIIHTIVSAIRTYIAIWNNQPTSVVDSSITVFRKLSGFEPQPLKKLNGIYCMFHATTHT